VLQTVDNCQFTSPCWDKTANSDKDRNHDNCTTNAWVSCRMHDNNAITEHFPMNVIPKAWNWGQGTATLHHLGVESKSLTRTRVTTAQWVFIMQTYKYLCVLSDAWQWFHNRVFYNECDSLCFKLGTTANLLYHGTKLPIVSRTGMTAAQPMFVLQWYQCLSLLSAHIISQALVILELVYCPQSSKGEGM